MAAVRSSCSGSSVASSSMQRTKPSPAPPFHCTWLACQDWVGTPFCWVTARAGASRISVPWRPRFAAAGRPGRAQTVTAAGQQAEVVVVGVVLHHEHHDVPDLRQPVGARACGYWSDPPPGAGLLGSTQHGAELRMRHTMAAPARRNRALADSEPDVRVESCRPDDQEPGCPVSCLTSAICGSATSPTWSRRNASPAAPCTSTGATRAPAAASRTSVPAGSRMRGPCARSRSCTAPRPT